MRLQMMPSNLKLREPAGAHALSKFARSLGTKKLDPFGLRTREDERAQPVTQPPPVVATAMTTPYDNAIDAALADLSVHPQKAVAALKEILGHLEAGSPEAVTTSWSIFDRIDRGIQGTPDAVRDQLYKLAFDNDVSSSIDRPLSQSSDILSRSVMTYSRPDPKQQSVTIGDVAFLRLMQVPLRSRGVTNDITTMQRDLVKRARAGESAASIIAAIQLYAHAYFVHWGTDISYTRTPELAAPPFARIMNDTIRDELGRHFIDCEGYHFMVTTLLAPPELRRLFSTNAISTNNHIGTLIMARDGTRYVMSNDDVRQVGKRRKIDWPKVVRALTSDASAAYAVVPTYKDVRGPNHIYDATTGKWRVMDDRDVLAAAMIQSTLSLGESDSALIEQWNRVRQGR
ncbi:MAG: hypothetical protein H7Z43_11340 [Clostridia bacterium]|nr:hypothetical protein [Deltaproteobacteria bacterium]